MAVEDIFVLGFVFLPSLSGGLGQDDDLVILVIAQEAFSAISASRPPVIFCLIHFVPTTRVHVVSVHIGRVMESIVLSDSFEDFSSV
jgi:hypothetical protein